MYIIIILMMSPLPLYAQLSGNILAAGISRDPLSATLQYKLMCRNLHWQKELKGN